MLSDNCAILADHNAVGTGLYLDRTAYSMCSNRVSDIVKAHQAGLRYCRHTGMEPIEAAVTWNQMGSLCLEHLPDRLVSHLWMLVGHGVNRTELVGSSTFSGVGTCRNPWAV